MSAKPGFAGFLVAALVFAAAGTWHEPLLRTVLIIVGVLAAIVIVGFVVWRVGTKDGIPRA